MRWYILVAYAPTLSLTGGVIFKDIVYSICVCVGGWVGVLLREHIQYDIDMALIIIHLTATTVVSNVSYNIQRSVLYIYTAIQLYC